MAYVSIPYSTQLNSIVIDSFNYSIANIRGHLAAAVPHSDQILLLGPPYKVPKDSTLQSDEVLNSLRLGVIEDDSIIPEETTAESKSQHHETLQPRPQSQPPQFHHSILSNTERTGARRLFLFSKQALSEHAPDPPPCHLEPMQLTLPFEAPGPSPLNMSQLSGAGAGSSLHQALAAYERQFMLYLCQGRVLADGADM
jgi:hypothetical protein